MIAVRLMGGLGNQMFQYAFGRQTAFRLGVPLALDLRWYDAIEPGDTPRQYELGRYPIRATIAPPGQLPPFPPRSSLVGRLLAPLTGRSRMQVRPCSQSGWSHDAALPQDDTLYVGYWQSEQYFPDVAADLQREFTPKTPPDGANADYCRLIDECTGVSVHVRRGDYVSNPAANRFHGLAPIDYYRQAIGLIRERVPGARFFVFSEDLDWCRENLPLDPTAVFVRGNDGDRAFEDLRLMSRCRHNVIANSSFSWWGAWLNPNPDKMVIAPKTWTADPAAEPAGLVPARWTRL